MIDDLTTGTQRPAPVGAARAAAHPALTIAWHPEVGRVGERFGFGSAPVGVSRGEPVFRQIGRPSGGSIRDRFVSRRPFVLQPLEGGGVALDLAGAGTEVVADGVRVADRRTFSAEDLARGVVLLLAYRVALVLHRHRATPPARSDFELVGESAALAEVRSLIERVADLTVPVLLRGESGTGKELVARAIHEAGPRAASPFVAVNMAAIPSSAAAAELFGHARGAFTGAGAAHGGYFAAADGGTLFLDEVGDTPEDLQLMLLRVLETGEVQPVGRSLPRRVDVRIVAATDSRIERRIAEGRVREPFYHRLAGFEVYVPPLRERRDDIGALWLHFLRQELTATGEQELLTASTQQPWLPATVMARLLAFDWPGNVRQLRNAARQLAIASRGRGLAVVDHRLERLLSEVAQPREPAPPSVRTPPEATRPSALDDARLIEALRRNHWQIGPTASDLGIARSSLYLLIERSPSIRKATDVPRVEIVAALESTGGHVALAAARLEVSKRGLQLRMRELGLAG